MAKTANNGIASRMRETQVNPFLVIAVFLLIAGGLGYFFWLRPMMATNKIQREWSSPEQAALRAPGGRPEDPSHEALVAKLREKERGSGAHAPTRRRDSGE